MGHKGALRIEQILANRSKAGLEETVLLITEQLGFRYFMFCGRFSLPRGAIHKVRFFNFPVMWLPYSADRWWDVSPARLVDIPFPDVTPRHYNTIAISHAPSFANT